MRRTGRTGNSSAALTVNAAAAHAMTVNSRAVLSIVSSLLHVFGADRQLDRALELSGEIDRLGEHQPVVALAGGRVLGRHAERYAVQPRVGLLAHRTAQLAERHVADRVAGQEIDVAALVGRVALGL